MLTRLQIVVIPAVLLAACGGPSPHFAGAPSSTITVDGMRFVVRQRGTLAEAVRIDSRYAPRMSGIAVPAEAAIAAVTGCRVLTLRGDAAMMLAEIDCA